VFIEDTQANLSPPGVIPMNGRKSTPVKTSAGPIKILSFPELKTEKGIPFSRQWVAKLVKAKQFPAPVKLGLASNGFIEAEIDEWIIARINERDAKAPKKSPPQYAEATA
jgi:prophage regulatory protein